MARQVKDVSAHIQLLLKFSGFAIIVFFSDIFDLLFFISG